MTRVLVPERIAGAAPLLGARVQRLRGESMGTTWQVLWADRDAARHEAVRAAVEAELGLVVAQMSTWLPTSDLERFNAAPPGMRRALPEAFAEVLAAALWLAEASSGAFNPAAGALVNLWGFGPAPRYTDPGFVPPGADAVHAALAGTDWRALRFDAAAREATQPGGLRLDFSAIAKGHAVDRVARRLGELGIAHALVEVGGELRGQGLRPDGMPWWVDLETPPVAAGHAVPRATRVALHGLSVATSGDYRRAYLHGGQRLPHSIDPRTGQPVAHGLASVSVLHAECLWADAWSTALTVAGREQGLALAEAHGIAALFVQREADGCLTETLTSAMERLAG
ncbi:MAG: FAD:protein FMN transferase [Hydrogenophaga sp.]|uniref:FAD:protein FMN transferase n=1 Tax=Hydrogenophaga sp. TaxID=1904254 RepID=UPI0016AAF8AF|nr:FAD:protein FMN transferase [Hydrogenophaga sp.]NIM43473.1 FAD:protein FMN transferase [Hydrogenophaga sp.]NIN28542.1 FAD:protein FMN transferase [Hydrogenophaga sp.]NIN33001.1 FAD:protein FMN transferase [Hydrogenophaga sp.]NIN57676.1 FAD:protein FMN transferase [Hydrogenophaga sp.]NIO53971.1 FAD:protein FMN transferase [Hydrogenophaga sp.]